MCERGEGGREGGRDSESLELAVFLLSFKHAVRAVHMYMYMYLS